MSETSLVVEKSLRSVFVGNIPYEATEEKLRDIFSQVGPVLSFKLMYDRESGKPKGYGFCEYKDQETALSAMRNLNGFEIGGRPLRVDNACTEKSRMEMQSLMMGPVVESPYGPEVEHDKAPEAISNAVASLPPEQMYELMRQMKLCVRNNPAEARTMLMNNPQLAYALLQAQVVMRIIDPKTAVQILHGSRDSAEPVVPSTIIAGPTIPASLPNVNAPTVMNGGPVIPPVPSNMPTHFPAQNAVPPGGPPVIGSTMGPRMSGPPAPQLAGPPVGVAGPGGTSFPPPSQPVHPAQPPPNRGPFPVGDYDLRQMMGNPSRGPAPPQVLPPGPDQDMRMPSAPHDNFGPPPVHDFEGRFQRDFDQRDNRIRDPPNPSNRERDAREMFNRDPRDNRDRDARPARDPRDPRGMERERERERDRDRDRDYRNNVPPMDRDPRGRNFPGPDKDFRSREPAPGPNTLPPPSAPRPPPTGPPSNIPPSLAGQDQEKASLIMQVLQLSDEQIRMLPPEQQASILQLKEQIQRSSH